ncbi:UDP-glucose 4-epimerase GalE [Acinetobacter sp. HY1485]|uniref:UDP-glucose 4-epimerase GalE n=1 Tax=Acinetobacter sp. HY1485 TaxID=2970918 RepID=UPI0022B94DC0|nr:UDP-glucose 4-epimerase GalE [Acinetobacter sp. HY1485]
MANILVTGGAGFIGSHTCVELLDAGHDVIVFDNLCNSSVESLQRVEQLTQKNIIFIEGDIRKQQQLDEVFQQHQIDAVIHFAGLKAVGESQKIPLAYFDNNVAGSTTLFKAMEKAQVFTLVFSSSATVYGDTHPSPLKETMPTGMPNNNYGYTKLIVEQMLEKLAEADARWSIALLRYFNPVGAHESGEIGEDPQGIPNNLMPYVTQVAIGKREKLSIFGHDYDTVDGTGVRDYIHVVDLADAHLCALNNRLKDTGCRAWNIGTGNGFSVLQIRNTFQDINQVDVPFEYSARREGDVATCFADNQRALDELGWQPKRGLKEMLKDSWNWQKKNPQGYRST